MAEHGHAHGHGHSHSHAPANFNQAFAWGIALNLVFVAGLVLAWGGALAGC